MACNCGNIVCLGVVPVICSDEIHTDVIAAETATWVCMYEFNGRWFGFELSVTEDQRVVLPNVFNECYTHLLKFYNPLGNIIGNTCYSLNTCNLIGAVPSLPSAATTDKTRQLTLTFRDSPSAANDIEISNTITLELLKTVSLQDILFWNDTPQNWNKRGIALDTVDGTLTLPDNYEPADGDYITIQYNLP